MEDRSAEVRDRRGGGICGGNREGEGEKTVGIRCMCGSSKEEGEVCEVIGGRCGVGGEEVIGWERVAMQSCVVGCKAAEGARVLTRSQRGEIRFG